MTFDDSAREDLLYVCRKMYAENPQELRLVNDFEKDYCPEKAIWWYTRQCFTYQLLNRALRCLEGDMIVDMGFFIHDLHNQIEKLHREQLQQYGGKSFLLYRGQKLSTDDFGKLQNTRGGLLSFNSFLSTSEKRSVSLQFAQISPNDLSLIGVLFIMTIDPRTDSTPFANVKNHSEFQIEDEILFSMHAVFRIERISSMDTTHRPYEVHLTLTSGEDPTLKLLEGRIHEEFSFSNDEQRLIYLLIRIGHTSRAEEIGRAHV